MHSRTFLLWGAYNTGCKTLTMVRFRSRKLESHPFKCDGIYMDPDWQTVKAVIHPLHANKSISRWTQTYNSAGKCFITVENNRKIEDFHESVIRSKNTSRLYKLVEVQTWEQLVRVGGLTMASSSDRRPSTIGTLHEIIHTQITWRLINLKGGMLARE